MPENIAYLHDHSEYSNLRMLDCTIKIESLIDKSVELGAAGIAITDHESVSGHVRAIKHVKSGKEKGKIPKDFKLILGNEIYLVDEILVDENGKKSCPVYYHFILLAKDEVGHKQLRELSSLAWDNSFKTGKMERVPTLKSDLMKVVKNNPGHLIATTACIGGELGKCILATENNIYGESPGEQAFRFLNFCQELFGSDFYLEMQPSDSEEQKLVNEKIISLSQQNDIPYIITTDTHYLRKTDREVHEAYLNSREDEERELGEFYATTYMMSVDEIHQYLDKQIGERYVSIALENTVKIAEKVEEFDLYHPTIVPGADVPEFELCHTFKEYYDTYEYIKKFSCSENIYDRYLLKLIENGWKGKIPYNTFTNEELDKHLSRIEVELKEMWLVTEKLKTSISSYYITTLELIDIMWNEGDSLVGVARGSVTGMFTMYLIGLIQMNPITWGLPHWRHISHEKIELSDVDLDSQQSKRSQIIEAIKDRKGERHVLNACTFKTEGSKSAILTAGRGLGLDSDVTSYIANMIPVTRGFTWSLSDCIHGNKEEKRKPVTEFINECKKYPMLLETAQGIEGLVNGRSIHASAVYLFNEDFLAHNARMRAPNGTFVTQFNMKDSDYCSGLKMD